MTPRAVETASRSLAGAGAAATGGLRLNSVANAALESAARLWFLVTVTGQWIFAFYAASFYGGSALRGEVEAWNQVLPHGYVGGDTVGNLVVGTHLLFAVVVLAGGPLQLVPQVRARAPAFHRWNGRVYLLTALALSLGGLHMVWTRGAVGDVAQHLAISINAVLIIACAIMVLRHALARDTVTHRRWALRLFLVVSGVWFFRVGLMFWLALHGGPAGFDPETFEGPFLTFLAFAQYIVPLAILELYLRTKARGDTPGKFAMAGGLFVLTTALGVGIVAATLGMWLPRI